MRSLFMEEEPPFLFHSKVASPHEHCSMPEIGREVKTTAVGSSRKADWIKNELPRQREAPDTSGPAKRSPPSRVCGGEEGFRDERRAKGTSWVTRQVFQTQRDYPSRFFYCYIILKWVLSHFFSPRSLEGGRFSSHCRSVNSACRDSPRTSLPREALISQG